MPGFEGYLTPSFDCHENTWRSTSIFNYTYKEIAQISFQNFVKPQESFIIEKSGSNFSTVRLAVNNLSIERFDTAAVNEYLMQFTNLNYEAISDKVRQTRKDSALNMPMFKVNIALANGRKQSVLFLRKPVDRGMVDDFGKPTDYDTERMFAILNDNKKEFLVAQYYVFDKILRAGHSFLK